MATTIAGATMKILSSNKDETEFTVHVDELKKYVKAVRKEALQEAIDSLPKPYLEVGVNPEGLYHKQLHNHALELCRANIAALLDKE